jgi:DNA invertase Pin-like site-specific DNA recombinase
VRPPKLVGDRIAVVAYCRLSKNTGEEDDSVDRQKRILIAYAKRNNLYIVEFFSDRESAWRKPGKGRKPKPRPGWDGFLAALEAGEYDGVTLGGALSYHLDRLARNDHAAADLLNVLMDGDLPLYTPEQLLDLGSSGDARSMYRMIMMHAIAQSEATSRRICAQKDDARQRGDLHAVLGGPPSYGFRKELGSKRWEIDPVAQKILVSCAQAIVDGLPYAPIAEKNGIEPKHILAALKREETAGLMMDCGRRKIFGLHNSGAIIERTLWDRMMVVLISRQRGRPATELYPYSKVLQCSLCKNQLTGEPESPSGKPMYMCANKHPKLNIKKGCRKISIRTEDLHPYLEEAVRLWAINDPQAAESFTRQRDYSKPRAELQRQLDLNRRATANLSEKFNAGRLLEPDYDKQDTVLAKEFDQINRELAALAEEETTTGPATLEWDEKTPGAVKVLAVEAAFETPIPILPRRRDEGGYRDPGERIAAEPRKLKPRRKQKA